MLSSSRPKTPSCGRDTWLPSVRLVHRVRPRRIRVASAMQEPACTSSQNNDVGLSVVSTLTTSATPPCDFVSGRPLLYLLCRQNACRVHDAAQHARSHPSPRLPLHLRVHTFARIASFIAKLNAHAFRWPWCPVMLLSDSSNQAPATLSPQVERIPQTQRLPQLLSGADTGPSF